MIGSERYSETSTVSPFGSTRSVTCGIRTAAAGGPMGGGVDVLDAEQRRGDARSPAVAIAATSASSRPGASSRHRRRTLRSPWDAAAARPGFGRSGTSSTVVRSASTRYVLATRCTSAAVTASTRSTSLNISR